MPFDGGADQLHDKHSLANAGAAEHRGLAARYQRGQQVDHFNPSVENLEVGTEPVDGRGRRVDRPIHGANRKGRSAIGRLADRVEQSPEHGVSDRYVDGPARRPHPGAAA